MKTHAIVQADRHSEREARVVIANVADLMNEKVMYKVEHHPEFNGVDLVATDNKIKIREDERKHIPAGYTSPFSGPNGNGLRITMSDVPASVVHNGYYLLQRIDEHRLRLVWCELGERNAQNSHRGE